MDIQICRVAIKLTFITILLFRQAEGEDKYRRMRICTYDSDCISNAYCNRDNYCQCKNGFVIHVTAENKYFCLKEASSLGDDCEADIQCTLHFGNHAECTDKERGAGKCGCMENAHFKEDRCYETASIGQKCKVNNNCHLASGQPAYCIKSKCVCHNGYRPNQAGTECIRTSHLDEPCSSDQECVAENSRCGGVCRCRVDYIQSSKKEKCLKAALNMGDLCLEKEQCTMFLHMAMCNADGRCSCNTGYHHIPPNSKCYPNIGLGERCDETFECVVPSTVCSEGICQCESGLIPSADNSICNGGDNGQKAVRYSLNVLLMTLVLPRIFHCFVPST